MSPLEIFLAHLGPLTWDDLVAGHDFGFLSPEEVQVEAPGDGPALRRLRALRPGLDPHFEAHLWAACAEATGRAPRPGSAAWARAQDRWREAILRESLASDLPMGQLAKALERLYEQLGCPEDMLPLVQPAPAWSGLPATVDPAAVARFLEGPRSRREGPLA